jgi:hypothetical protein
MNNLKVIEDTLIVFSNAAVVDRDYNLIRKPRLFLL